MLSAANVHDSKVLEEALDAIEPIGHPAGKPGRPRKRPEKLHTDKGYDFPRCRKALRGRGIKARIARRGADSSERLGRHRWVVERTLAWLACYRRLSVRYGRRADIPEAFLHLGEKTQPVTPATWKPSATACCPTGVLRSGLSAG